MRNAAFRAQIWFLSAELILSICLLGATCTYIAFRPQLWSPFNGLAAWAGLTFLYSAIYLIVLCVTQISWFTSMVADAFIQGVLCAGGPVCLGFAINNTLGEMHSLDKVNINAAVVIFIGLALTLIQWFHLWIKVILVLAKCGGSMTVWKQSFCNLMDRNQPRDLDDFMIVNPHQGGKRLSETEPIYGDAFDERGIETPPRLSTSTVVEDRNWLRSKYSINEKSPASTAPALQYDPFPCATMDFDVPVLDEPGSPIYTLPASYSNHRYSSDSLNAGVSDENLPSLRYGADSRRQSVQSFADSRMSGEYQHPSFDVYRSNSGNSYRLVDGARPPSLDMQRVEPPAPVAHSAARVARTPSLQAQRPAFDLYQDDMGSEFSVDPTSTLCDHAPALYDPAPQYSQRRSPPHGSHYDTASQYAQRRSPPQDAQQTRYDPTQSARYAEPASRYEPAPRMDAPSPRYEVPASPRGSTPRRARVQRPKSYHGHAAHPPIARSKSYVESPYEAARPPSRSRSHHGHGQGGPEPPQPVRRYSQDDGSGRRWSQSSYTSLPRVPSMLRHSSSEVSEDAIV